MYRSVVLEHYSDRATIYSGTMSMEVAVADRTFMRAQAGLSRTMERQMADASFTLTQDQADAAYVQSTSDAAAEGYWSGQAQGIWLASVQGQSVINQQLSLDQAGQEAVLTGQLAVDECIKPPAPSPQSPAPSRQLPIPLAARQHSQKSNFLSVTAACGSSCG